VEGLFSTRSKNTFFNVKASGCQDNCEREPEATVGGERGGTESITNGHFPVVACQKLLQLEHSNENTHTTCQREAVQDLRSQRPRPERDCFVPTLGFPG
jgi:hypothetical protein